MEQSKEKTVETKVETAVAQPKKEETSSQNTQEVDYEAELAKANQKIAKINEEKENYRKGMLKAKGKLPDEDDNSSEEDLDAKIERKVQEKLLATREAEVQSEKDKLIADMAKKTKELSLALKNRGQISTTSAPGSNEDKPEVKAPDKVLSTDQIANLKAKGWSDTKIEDFKKNLALGIQSPK